MKATIGTRINPAHALTAMMRDRRAPYGHVEMVNVETGERRPWITHHKTGPGCARIVEARLIKGGTDLIEVAAEYWRDYNHATDYDMEELALQGYDAEELGEEVAQEIIAADAKLCDAIEEAVNEAAAEGWRVDVITYDVPGSGRSEWTAVTGKVTYEGTREAFCEHQWTYHDDTVTPRYPDPVWTVTESTTP